MDQLIQWINFLQMGAAALARLLGLADLPPDREAGQARPADQELRADQISHAYVPGHDVLRQLSLTVAPGERIAIVGPSGAGKSTLGRLLAGIQGPDAGEVRLGGVGLVDLPLDELRGQIALVSQEHHIFQGSLRDNVTLGLPQASEQAILAALEAVDALGWAQALPDGLDTPVGSGGLALSAPQAQQIALARLVLADPHTLILDEATSLLDPQSARHLEQSLAAVLDGRTVVAIAHRLHTAHDADRVVVMERGQISESGPHQQLIAANGAYAGLWKSWHGNEEDRQRHPQPGANPQIPVHGAVDNARSAAACGG
jgi:ABC-type multidrug transport system fused ATPase/permease subunit